MSAARRHVASALVTAFALALLALPGGASAELTTPHAATPETVTPHEAPAAPAPETASEPETAPAPESEAESSEASDAGANTSVHRGDRRPTDGNRTGLSESPAPPEGSGRYTPFGPNGPGTLPRNGSEEWRAPGCLISCERAWTDWADQVLTSFGFPYVSSPGNQVTNWDFGAAIQTAVTRLAAEYVKADVASRILEEWGPGGPPPVGDGPSGLYTPTGPYEPSGNSSGSGAPCRKGNAQDTGDQVEDRGSGSNACR
jgi:hypothetical protein